MNSRRNWTRRPRFRRVEDLYRPYKPKRQTRAAVARERGLEPLRRPSSRRYGPGRPRPYRASLQMAAPFVTDQVPDVEAALAGTRHHRRAGER